MKRFAFLILVLTFGFAADAAPDRRAAAFCRALSAVAGEARRSRAPQEFVVFLLPDDQLSFACRHGSDAVSSAFCSTAAQVVGVEFTHIFPWRINDCLVARGIGPVLEQTDQYTGIGRRRIVHLRAQLRGGGAVDVRWEPSGDASDAPEFKGYYGVYRVAVSPR